VLTGAHVEVDAAQAVEHPPVDGVQHEVLGEPADAQQRRW
jgi:hypothetical protein